MGFRQGVLAVAVAMVWIGAEPAWSAITVNPWTPIYKGVDYATGEADAGEPALQKVNVFRIDLEDPDIAFLTTPSNGGASMETNARKASTFLTTRGVQVAINANFYNPGALFQSDGDPKDLEGLAISQGTLVSPQETDPVANRGQVLLITQANEARFENTTNNPISLTGVYNAVAGDARVLVNGNAGVGAGGDREPRTAVGISQDDRYLIMLTIDGRQSGFSDGATLFEVNEWLVRYGAHNGVALDGGGSTTMVRSDDQGGATVLNSPIGAGFFGSSLGERYNGNHLGAFAAPILVGDMDRNGQVDVDDIGLFELAATNPAAYTAQTGRVPDPLGDVDGSGVFDSDDVDDFIALLNAPPAGPGQDQVAAVPEPASIVLFLLGSVGAGVLVSMMRRRR